MTERKFIEYPDISFPEISQEYHQVKVALENPNGSLKSLQLILRDPIDAERPVSARLQLYEELQDQLEKLQDRLDYLITIYRQVGIEPNPSQLHFPIRYIGFNDWENKEGVCKHLSQEKD